VGFEYPATGWCRMQGSSWSLSRDHILAVSEVGHQLASLKMLLSYAPFLFDASLGVQFSMSGASHNV
jgi:hypothetical protein